MNKENNFYKNIKVDFLADVIKGTADEIGDVIYDDPRFIAKIRKCALKSPVFSRKVFVGLLNQLTNND